MVGDANGVGCRAFCMVELSRRCRAFCVVELSRRRRAFCVWLSCRAVAVLSLWLSCRAAAVPSLWLSCRAVALLPSAPMCLQMAPYASQCSTMQITLQMLVLAADGTSLRPALALFLTWWPAGRPVCCDDCGSCGVQGGWGEGDLQLSRFGATQCAATS
eukprot:363910-Chlamydomonas_euryale.AAC.9